MRPQQPRSPRPPHPRPSADHGRGVRRSPSQAAAAIASNDTAPASPITAMTSSASTLARRTAIERQLLQLAAGYAAVGTEDRLPAGPPPQPTAVIPWRPSSSATTRFKCQVVEITGDCCPRQPFQMPSRSVERGGSSLASMITSPPPPRRRTDCCTAGVIEHPCHHEFERPGGRPKTATLPPHRPAVSIVLD